MSYTQFGYTYPTAATASSLASSQLLVSAATPTSTSTTSCCEGGRPIMTDPHTGQTVCSCQYSASLLSYPRVGLPESVYGSAYAAQGYMPFTTDPSAFYSPLDNSEAWRSLAQPTACYPYDPMTAGYAYGQSALAQRKNATREATGTLKAWLQEHIKNPYPTKGEKIMLAIITKMTLTQVSTWFANARRRLKKENKMTWSPRNRTDDDRDKLDSDDEDGDEKDNSNEHKDEDGDKKHVDDDDDEINIDTGMDGDVNVSDDDIVDPLASLKRDSFHTATRGSNPPPHLPGDVATASYPPVTTCSAMNRQPIGNSSAITPPLCLSTANKDQQPSVPQKPRIWSLADVATSGIHPSKNNNVPSSIHQTGLPGHHRPHPMDHLNSKPTDSSLYTPNNTNGFRPWVNGSAYHHPNQGSVSQSTGLLRAYALAHRAEVH